MKRIVSSVLLSAGALFVGSAVLSRRSTQGIHSNVQPTNKDSSINPSSTSASILSCVHDGVMQITLNRPAVLNALDLDMVETLQQLLMAARTDETIRAIVITGKGRAFCAGGDLKFAVEANPDRPGNSFLALTAVLHTCIEEIRTMSKPVIAAINGPAAGAGLFLALACDLRMMANTAYLKQSNTSYGLSLPAGGTFTLPRLVGVGRALEIVMLDQPIPAKKADELGLVNRVVSGDRLLSEAQTLATQVAQMPIDALGQVKQLMNESFYSTLSEQLAAERQAIAISANSLEGREGLSAFMQKRSPVFAPAGN
jgi:2-(1,2-epoxy-1,2-dihydrophenyl)acetyl-CoA isomerase